MTLLDHQGVREAYQTHQAARMQEANERVAKRYEFVRLFSEASEEMIGAHLHRDDRLTFDLPQLDDRLRGVGRGELCFITGKAHSGKTQLVLHMLIHEAGRRMLFFTPDETQTTVLAKLVAMRHGLDVKTLESRLRQEDPITQNLVRREGADTFGNLIVIDQPLTFDQMAKCYREAEDLWGEKCEGVVVDYLDLLPGSADYTGTKSKATGLKRWTKTYDVPMICVHQPRRGGAQRGQTIGMDDMHMGGETEGTFVLGVFRKRDDEYLLDNERETYRDTVSVTISKNKRPPCETGTFDFYLDSLTGSIRPLQREDLHGDPIFRSAAQAQALRR